MLRHESLTHLPIARSTHQLMAAKRRLCPFREIIGQESREPTLSILVLYKAMEVDCKFLALQTTYCTTNSYFRKG